MTVRDCAIWFLDLQWWQGVIVFVIYCCVAMLVNGLSGVAEPSRPPTFKAFGVKPKCYGCGRTVRATERLWFRGYPTAGVWGWCCFKQGAKL